MRLQDKRAVILGGTSGMGLALAQLAIAEGGSVVVAGHSQAHADKAKTLLGEKAQAIALDIGNEAAVKAAFAAIGSFDHLVTTAAKLTYGPLADLAVADVNAMLSSKFWGPFFAAREAASRLKTGGSITFFSGLAAYRPGPGTSVVASLNAALEGFAMALAVELAPLRVNVISPGVVETPGWDFMAQADRNALFATLRASLPARRIGEPEDVAEAVLAVMTNPYITGTVLHADGGGRLA